jgi:beta-glucosidase
VRDRQGVHDTVPTCVVLVIAERPFTGRLPHSWPRSAAQEPVNVGDRGYDPLFRYGFGLRR